MPLGAAADCGGNATRGLCLCRSYCDGVLNLAIDNVKYGRTDVKLCVGLDTSYRRIVISVNPHCSLLTLTTYYYHYYTDQGEAGSALGPAEQAVVHLPSD